MCLSIVIALIVFASILTCFCIHKFIKVIKVQRTKINALSRSLQETNNKLLLLRKCKLDNEEYHVLCIGNSITIHPPYDAIKWYSNHGMAASTPQRDYCHILEEKMRKHNPRSTVSPVNIAVWERDFSIKLNTILGEVCKGKNIIVIRLGENVLDTKHFNEALSCLIDYCLTFTTNIILTGQYWKNIEKEKAIISNAHKYGLIYVPLDWILESYPSACSPQEGDIIYDANGTAYPIEGSFILSHPNDYGMQLIANSIYRSL